MVNFSYKGIEFKVLLDHDEQTISESIKVNGVWEPWQLDLYPKLLQDTSTFLDIGANVGINSIYASLLNSSTRVIAVEPIPSNFKNMILNIKNARANVEVVQKAVTSNAGKKLFVGSGTNAHELFSKENDVNAIEVDGITLDQLTAELGLIKIDLLKIDVEGFTDEVLSDSSRTLEFTDNLILEISIFDLLAKFDGDHEKVLGSNEDTVKRLRIKFPHMYYISRQEGLVELELGDMLEVLFIEQKVGDFLFTKKGVKSISSISYLARRIRDLQNENHKRILENQDKGYRNFNLFSWGKLHLRRFKF